MIKQSHLFHGVSILGITLCIFNFSSCKKSDSTSSPSAVASGEYSPVKNDWLVLWSAANPTILNPILKTDAYATEVTTFLFDSLISYRADTGEPEGRLAERWEISKDGLKYDFYLKKNLTFSDGKPLTAEDVKFTFDTIKNPKVDAAHLQNYYAGLDKVEIISPQHLRFTMKNAYFRNLIMLGLADVLPKHVYGVGDFNTLEANRNPVGSGPYKFSKWENGRSIELIRNENWWGLKDDVWKNRYNFNKILFRIITEPTVALMALKKGEIDLMEPTTSQWAFELNDPSIEQKFYKLNYETIDGAGYSYIGWNLKNPLFDSIKVRQALAQLMPREEINKKVFGGMRKLAIADFNHTSPKIDPALKPYAYDNAKAVSLLAEDGWAPGKDGVLTKNGKAFKFELLLGQGISENERIALIFREALREVGIDMSIRGLEWSVYMQQTEAGKFDAMLISWGSSLDGDPYQIWHSSQAVKGGSNRIQYKNPRVDEILTKARVTLDREKRNKLYQEFSRIVYEETPYLFLFERPHLLVASKRFQGVLPVGKLGTDLALWYTPMGLEKYKDTSTAKK